MLGLPSLQTKLDHHAATAGRFLGPKGNKARRGTILQHGLRASSAWDRGILDSSLCTARLGSAQHTALTERKPLIKNRI